MELKDTITLLLAAYGAGLSTYLAVIKQRDKKPRLSAKLSFGFLTQGSRLSDPHLLLEAANIGEKPITLSSGGLLLPDKSLALHFSGNSSVSLPHELAVGKNMMLWFEAKTLAQELSQKGYSGVLKLRAKFNDQTSRVYVSKPLKFVLSQWLK